MFCKTSWSNLISETTWDHQKSSEHLPLRAGIKKRESNHCTLCLGEKRGMFLGGRKIFNPMGTNLGLRVKGSIKSEGEKSLAWPSVRRETSSQIFPTWTFQSQHRKTRNKLQWSTWDFQPGMRQDLLSPGDCDPAEVSFFLRFHRLGRCSALLDLDLCSWPLYRGSGPGNGSIWNQGSLERAHREVWRLHGNSYPDPRLNWWPGQSQLCAQGVVYLHKLSLAVIITAI